MEELFGKMDKENGTEVKVIVVGGGRNGVELREDGRRVLGQK